MSLSTAIKDDENKVSGLVASLPPKEREVLTVLLQSYPAPVSKNELIQRVWMGYPDVSDDSLVRCISAIRRTIPSIKIEAVYGFGYRILSLADSSAKSDFTEALKGPLSAVQTYLHARSLLLDGAEGSFTLAITLFRKLVSDYPAYVPARIGLALAISAAVAWGDNERYGVTPQEAWCNINIAAQLSPDAYALPRIRAVLYDQAWLFDEAEELFKEALRRGEDDIEVLLPYIWHLMCTQRQMEAIEIGRKACRYQPYALNTRIILARAYYMAGQYDEALQTLSIAEATHGTHHPVIASQKVMIQAFVNPKESLISAARSLNQLNMHLPLQRVSLPYVLARCGQYDESYLEIERVRKQGSKIDQLFHTSALIALGEINQAAQKLKEAYEGRYGWLAAMLRYPEYAAILDHPHVARISNDVYSSIRNING